MGTRLGVLGAILALTFTSGTTFAQSADASAAAEPGVAPAPPPAPVAATSDERVGADDRVFEGSAGLKLLLGGSLWSTPGNIPGGYEGIGFAGSAGGFAYGGAVYAEGRFFKYLGLELDVGYDDTTLKRKVTYNKTVDVHESVETSGMFFGLLIKGVVPAPFGRAWIGVGPQFKSAGSADGKLDGAAFPDGFINAKAESSTMLNLGLGMVIHAGDLIEIPIELRAAKNLSQEADWDKRVKLNTSGTTVTSYEVTAQSSWDFRLGLGVGARF